MKIDNLSPDSAILREFGKRLARIRKQHGFSQVTLAERAGIGVATLKRIEAGHDSQLESWIKVMKSLSMTAALDSLLPETFNSPMQEVLNNRRHRKISQINEGAIKWGDESK